MNYDKEYLQAGYLFTKMSARIAAGETFEKDAGVSDIWEWLKDMYAKVMNWMGGRDPEAISPGAGNMRSTGEAFSKQVGEVKDEILAAQKLKQQLAGGLATKGEGDLPWLQSPLGGLPPSLAEGPSPGGLATKGEGDLPWLKGL
jgi:hypothetical protein